MRKSTMTVEEIIERLLQEEENETMEGKILKPKLIRELYKQVGKPEEEDFEEEMETARCTWWDKIAGYTTHIQVKTKGEMKSENNAPTTWHIKKPSERKVAIVERYTRGGWHSTVQSFNVLCKKYAKHPKYKNLWVECYSTRDCAKYEYVLEKGE